MRAWLSDRDLFSTVLSSGGNRTETGAPETRSRYTKDLRDLRLRYPEQQPTSETANPYRGCAHASSSVVGGSFHSSLISVILPSSDEFLDAAQIPFRQGGYLVLSEKVSFSWSFPSDHVVCHRHLDGTV